MEKTEHWEAMNGDQRKHLHGRGEDAVSELITACRRETPPRTWRRLPTFLFALFTFRNTSTDVEKTSVRKLELVVARKHLHGRGEDCARRETSALTTETPPRTWRRLPIRHRPKIRRRNTSTDVEKTRNWNRRSRFQGNTSTDVEKTKKIRSLCDQLQKHLHGRGED